ncbi:hypothetical protein CHUAL_009553 [Chamberlinius hualienensis]
MTLSRGLCKISKSQYYWKEWTFILTLWAFIYYSGVTVVLFEKDYQTEFSYPLDVNVPQLILQWKSNEKPDVEPINEFNNKFIINNIQKCQRDDEGKLRLLYVIKSKYDNFIHREAIRETWGQEQEDRNSSVRRIFLLGLPPDEPSNFLAGYTDAKSMTIQAIISQENAKFKDIIQSDFHDTYFNNTRKALMAMKWVIKYCSTAEFIFFVDDDYYVSTKNVFRYLEKPNRYPFYILTPNFIIKKLNKDQKEDALTEMSKIPLYIGRVFPKSKPDRVFTSKWQIGLDEYPFTLYPPYINAGSYILSHEALLMFYYTSLYTKPFKFDDIYMAILAKKCNVSPVHNPYFYHEKLLPYNEKNYAFCIATHGYGNPMEMKKIWMEQHRMGNA